MVNGSKKNGNENNNLKLYQNKVNTEFYGLFS